MFVTALNRLGTLQAVFAKVREKPALCLPHEGLAVHLGFRGFGWRV